MYRTVADAALIEAAQRIAPLVRACRDESERERRLPAQVLAAMQEARLFRIYIPKVLDGLEIDPITSMIVVEEIARADAAAAWNPMLGATYGLWAAFLPEHAAREIYGAPDAVVAGALRPSGRARPVDRGFVVGGRWSFASGISHSAWLKAGCAWSSPPTVALRVRFGRRRGTLARFLPRGRRRTDRSPKRRTTRSRSRPRVRLDGSGVSDHNLRPGADTFGPKARDIIGTKPTGQRACTLGRLRHYILSGCIHWCGRRDSNPHRGFPEQILSLLRLPFRHVRFGDQPSLSPSCGSPPRRLISALSSSVAVASRCRSVPRNTKVTPKSPRRK